MWLWRDDITGLDGMVVTETWIGTAANNCGSLVSIYRKRVDQIDQRAGKCAKGLARQHQVLRIVRTMSDPGGGFQ